MLIPWGVWWQSFSKAWRRWVWGVEGNHAASDVAYIRSPLLLDDFFFHVAKAILAEEHFAADEKGGAAEVAACD